MNNREKVELQKKKTLELLTGKPIESTLTERWFLIDEASALYENESQPIAMGKGLRYILERASLPIDETDLLLGRYIDRVPTDEENKSLSEIWERRVTKKNPVTRYNRGHLTLDWETLVSIGITGYIERIRERLERAERENADDATMNYLRGMELTYEAIRGYILRYAEAAKRRGNDQLATVCENIAVRAPETFREAMQLILFVFTVYMIYGGWRVACLTLGRMDKYLLPFYLKDIEEGIATEDDIACIIDDFQCKMSLHLGRGEHQMTYSLSEGKITGWERNPVFDSPTYIVIDGYSNGGEKENPLTMLFAKQIIPQFKNPIYIYRWSESNSDEVKRVICDKIRKNASILVYNDDTMIPAMKWIGVDEQDAINYTVHPCNWPDIAGGYYALGKIGDTIPHMLYDAFFDKDGPVREFASVDEFYLCYEEYYKRLLKEELDSIRNKYLSSDLDGCDRLNLDDCFMAGPMEMARSSMYGGVKYPSVYMLIRNIGTAADMMAAIENVVFKEKKATLGELFEAMKSNFEGYGELLALCRRAPKYGVDNDVADGHAVRLMNLMLDAIDEVTNDVTQEQKIYPLCVTITDMDHLHNGKRLTATPDGRLSGQPLSENLSPTVGYYESVTALLNSVSKLPFSKIHSGVLNVRLREDLIVGDEGLERLMMLMNTYFKKGGIQLQVSVADTETLRKAQQAPENFGDLRVRITGYSAVFVDMSKNGQDEIIRREELGIL